MLGLILSLVAIIVISPFLVHWYGHKELFLLISSAGIGAYFYSWQSIPLSLMEREFKYGGVGLIEVADIFIFNLAAIIGSLTKIEIWGLAIGNVLRGFLPALLSLFISRFRPALAGDKKAIASLVRSVYAIFGSDFILWIIILAPPVLVGSLAGVKALGIAQMTYNLLGITMVIATIFQRISLASLSRIQEDRDQFNRFVHKALQLLSLINIPLTMGIASFSPWWIPIVYGDKWRGMEQVMLIAALPMTASAIFSLIGFALLAKGMASIVFKQNILHAIIYWISMAILATSLGALSVPIAHIFAMSAIYLFIYGYKKHCGTLDYRPIAALYFVGACFMALSWYTAMIGKVSLSFVLWAIFLIGWISRSPILRKKMLSAFNSYRGNS
jgi:O-antigen/teichoic acid export membrane protein